MKVNENVHTVIPCSKIINNGDYSREEDWPFRRRGYSKKNTYNTIKQIIVNIFKRYIFPLATYGYERWTISHTTKNKMKAFNLNIREKFLAYIGQEELKY